MRKLGAGELLPIAPQLRADHAALAGLLVPTPTAAIVATIKNLLALHNALEEGASGLYALCEARLGPALPALLERITAAPPVPLAPHHDGPRAFDNIQRLLRSARRDALLSGRAEGT